MPKHGRLLSVNFSVIFINRPPFSRFNERREKLGLKSFFHTIMKPLLPSLKEKKRYIVFEVISDVSLPEQDIYHVIGENMHTYVGDLGMAQAGLQFIPEKWNHRTQRGIARVSHTSADALKASFVFINSIKNNKVTVHSVGTSGILAKTQKYLTHSYEVETR